MKKRKFMLGAVIALAILLAAIPVLAQVSGRVTGTVTDSTGGVILDSEVSLQNERTGETRTARTSADGAFTFTNVPPNVYKIRVTHPGFNAFEKTGLVLNATQNLALGEIQLAVGEVTNTVSVEAQGAVVQTETSGQTALLSSRQLNGLMARGRDPVSLMTLLPGVAQNTSSDSLGGFWGTNTPNMSGARTHWNNFMLDGQPGTDIDAVNTFNMNVSMDAIEEISVNANPFLAESGRTPGAQVNIVSKSGTRQYHGTAYVFKRHEQFNANNFFNNRLGIAKPLGRYSAYGGTLGGPIFIPGKFNKNRDKLFFFFSQEIWRIKTPGPIFTATLPTEAERRGDFSQSIDQNGQLIQIIDPVTQTPFQGNIVPSSRINQLGQRLLSTLPSPNAFDRSITRGAFNYRFQEGLELPKRQTQFKFDWLPTAKDRITFRPRFWSNDNQGQTRSTAFGANYFLQAHHFEYLNNNYAIGYTRTFSPTVVNEFNFGLVTTGEIGELRGKFQLENVLKKEYGLEGLKQLFPEANPLGLIPQTIFGGLPNSPSSSFDPRTPIDAGDSRTTFSDNLSWINGKHTMKFGFFLEYDRASEGPRSAAAGRHMGTFDFSRDGNNAFDSNHPFTNALLGNFRSYSESSGKSRGRAKAYSAEWFAQDSWKVTRRLSVDLGVRFSLFTPWRLRDGEGAAWTLERFDSTKIPALYVPAIDPATSRRVAQNPLTGELVPVPLIGAVVPNSGDRLNGVVVGNDPSYPLGYRERPPVQAAPRVGFAWDVFGTGNTAIRGGGSVSKQTLFSSQASMWTTTTSPPILESPNIFYGNIDTFANAGQVLFPADAQSFDRKYDKPPTVYHWSLGIQQQLGLGTVLDVSYVGNTSRHLRQSRNLNTLAPGTRFLSASQDPTTGRPLPDVFLRPYRGFQGLGYIEDSGYSNYHSLQAGLNRRYTGGLQYGVAYTWSKAMGITNQDNGGLPMFRDYRTYLYGKLEFDQTHVFTLNYLWTLPNSAALGAHRFSRLVFHNWELGGIGTLASGFPQPINFSYTDGVDRWGGGDAPRVNMVQNPILSRGERSFSRWFNTNAFAGPGLNDFGNAPATVFRGPGIHNYDLTLFKNFPVGEGKRFQFRWEMYNLFNHTQWSGVDNNARFDPQGRQVNGQFGQVISARNAREMQLALRFEF